jgi:hypothetical protein
LQRRSQLQHTPLPAEATDPLRNGTGEQTNVSGSASMKQNVPTEVNTTIKHVYLKSRIAIFFLAVPGTWGFTLVRQVLC